MNRGEVPRGRTLKECAADGVWPVCIYIRALGQGLRAGSDNNRRCICFRCYVSTAAAFAVNLETCRTWNEAACQARGNQKEGDRRKRGEEGAFQSTKRPGGSGVKLGKKAAYPSSSRLISSSRRGISDSAREIVFFPLCAEKTTNEQSQSVPAFLPVGAG